MGEEDGAAPRVLYVAGWGRSGSTLLETLLSTEGTVCIGESFQLWSTSPLARYCSCGEPLDTCPVWGQVVASFDQPWSEVVDEMRGIRRRVLRTRYLPQLLGGRAWSGSDDVRRFGAVMADVYNAVARVTGAATVVDSSKLPLVLAGVLGGRPDLQAIHLVREPRAVAASWKRDVRWTMPDGSTLTMPTHPAWRSAAQWDLYNATTALVCRRTGVPTLRLTYESLVRLDAGALADLESFTGLSDLQARAEQAATPSGLPIPVQHAIAGNPGRQSGATLVLQEDDAWTSELSTGEQRAAAAIGWPYLVLGRRHRSA